MNGLMLCKPDNVPNVGDDVSLTAEPTQAQSGKSYTRFRRNGPDYGGTPHKVTSVSPTGKSDSHGNVWLNIDVQPLAAGTPTPQTEASDDKAKQIAWHGSLNLAVGLVATRGVPIESQVGAVKNLADELYPIVRAGAPDDVRNGPPQDTGAPAEKAPEPSQTAPAGNADAPQAGQTSGSDDDIPF